MAHAQQFVPARHTDSCSTTVKRSPLTAWSANEGTHPDRLDPYPLCAALENGYCQRQRGGMAGVKRLFRGGSASVEEQQLEQFCTSTTASEEDQNAKVSLSYLV